jgi:NAD(P)-dependent dehydrogenase (short-subunit alcohol dehydrogenase family)
MAQNWFITGTSRGFGREWTIAALERGDRVAATARDVSSLDDLVARFGDAILPLALDVTDRDADVAAVQQAAAAFGSLDVVINNAGYGQFGMIEELSEQEIRAQLETNFFGAFWVTQAALPIMREQGHGRILQVSSIGGVSAFMNIGAYHASKWALEGFSQSLALEVARFGIHVTLVEPGGFDTDWAGPSSRHATPIAAYDEIREERARQRGLQASMSGDPAATAAVLLELVDMAEPPLRVFFGVNALDIVKPDYEARLANWDAYQPLAIKASGRQPRA